MINGTAAAEPSVCCLILTFNRVAALRKCLSHVRAQTRQPTVIHIVDNGSSDETARFLAEVAPTEPSLTVSSFPENLGPAGGYAFGLDWCTRNQFTYCWVMDDDVFPAPGCLERLLQEMENADDRIVFPKILDRNERPANYPAWAGVLVPSSVVKLAGLPNEELFWWTEDTEYLQWRLPRIYGIRSLVCADARVDHGVDDGKEKPPWKYYYEVRNTIYYRSYVQKGNRMRRLRKTLLAISKCAFRALLLEKKKARKLSMVLLGIRHGITGHLGKVVDPDKYK